MFKMTLNQNDGVLLISYSGTFTIYDTSLFLHELQSKLQIIRPEEYVLVVDMQEIRPSSPELMPILEEIKRIYSEAPFRNVYTVEADGWLTPKTKKKSTGKPNWSSVQTVDEALEHVRLINFREKKNTGPQG